MSSKAETVDRICRAAALTEQHAETVDLMLADVSVRVHITGERLARAVLPSLLKSEIEGPQQIELWSVDAADAGVALPRLPWGAGDYLQRDEVRGWTEPPHLATFAIELATMSVADTDRRIGAQWFRDVALAPWEGGAPMRSLLHWHLARRGLHLLHAAAVETEAGGVLLAGPGGSGKSTSALAALGAGMKFVGDDYVLVRDGEPPTSHPVYAIAKADDRSLGLVPKFAERAEGAVADWRGKWRLPVADLVSPEARLDAIVLPTVSGRTGTPKLLERPEALRTLVPSMLFQLPADGRSTLAAISKLLDKLPVYSLDVGPDIARVPELLVSLLEAQAARA